MTTDTRGTPLFLDTTLEAESSYREALSIAQNILIQHYAKSSQPYSGASVQEISASLEPLRILPEESQSLTQVLQEVGSHILDHSVVTHHPTCVAHLQCPPLIASLAAEILISASNQSMDSWDESPAATLAEKKMIQFLCNLFGYTYTADGVFTSGGTQSNLMGLLLARDHFAHKYLHWNIKKQGLPPEANRMRIYCSEAAHFTVQQSASLLGLGEISVVPVKVTSAHRIDLIALQERILLDQQNGLIPFALVGTAGTTDFGSIDPLSQLAEIAHQHRLWFHVDAAYGGALILCDSLRDRLKGIEQADSITTDFHKLFYQPISCGAFLLKDSRHFQLMHSHAEYLNSEADEQRGIPNLVSKSLQTTRRFDALKLWVSMQTLGKKQFGSMIASTIEVVGQAAQWINDQPQLELMNPNPEMNALVFRYQSKDISRQDAINESIRHDLLAKGKVILAHTKVNGHDCLKITLLNPQTTFNQVQWILNQVILSGSQIESEKEGNQSHA